MRLCTVPGCGKEFVAKGYCAVHYDRSRIYGPPEKNKSFVSLLWVEAFKNHEEDDCLDWPFHKHRDGRSTIGYEGRKQAAARIMCIKAHGDPPADKSYALHSCGNGHLGCVNPKHLRWGTQAENLEDMYRQGRHLRNGSHFNSKLTKAQVDEIRSLPPGVNKRKIAESYGVSTSTIVRLLSGKPRKNRKYGGHYGVIIFKSDDNQEKVKSHG